MTNLLITLIAVTNWTGWVAPNGQEAGIICTDHVATVVYRQQTNTFKLLSEPSGVAVFRSPQVATNSIVVFTNSPHFPWVDQSPPRFWYPNLVVTNKAYITNTL